MGVRALVGMLGGTWLQYAAGSRSVFWSAFVLELVAGCGMYVVARATGRRWTVSESGSALNVE